MSRITRAEKWFGKKKKDLNEEERKEFEKLYSQEVKQYQVEYHKKWRKENPEKVKEYYTKYNNENKTLKEENDKLKQQIADLEEQLKNAIVPKFKIGQEVWFIYNFEDDDTNETLGILHKKVMAYTYSNYEGDYFEYAMSDDGTRDTIWYGYIDSRYIFATKEEAQAKLKELQGETK